MIKVDVWSDINCPFCYIGKRHLEVALSQLPHKEVEIIWHSFELDPFSHPPKGADSTDLLAKKYGRDRNWAIEMNQNVTQMAARAGLDFQLEKAIAANSLNAHRLIHLAGTHGLQGEMKEKLLSAKFVRGLDISDEDTLVKLGEEVGIKSNEIRSMLSSDLYTNQVRRDEEEAARLGIRGVPFFIVNNQFALSGAQPVEAFQEVFSKL